MKLKQYKPKGKYILLKRVVKKKIGSIYVPDPAEGELVPEFKVIKLGPDCKNVIEGEVVILSSINYLNQLSFEDETDTFTCEDNVVMGGYISE
jgi:hypothetical protein